MGYGGRVPISLADDLKVAMAAQEGSRAPNAGVEAELRNSLKQGKQQPQRSQQPQQKEKQDPEKAASDAVEAVLKEDTRYSLGAEEERRFATVQRQVCTAQHTAYIWGVLFSQLY